MNLGILAAFSSSITWAIGVTAYSKLATQSNPATINFSRSAISLPIFLVGSILTESASWMNIQIDQIIWLIVSILSSYAFGDVLFLFSALRIGVPGALAIASTYILWASIAGVVFKGATLSKVQWLGVWIILIGTVIVILSGYKLKKASAKDYWIGIALAIGTSCLWALNTYGISKGGENLPATTVNSIRMLLSVLLCPVIGRMLNQNVNWKMPLQSLKRINFKRYGWAMLLESVVGASLFTYGLTHAPLPIAATLSSLAPVLSVPVSWILKTEAVHIQKLVGVITVTAGIALLLNG
jgi:drug/metabolite transporter (DMT)-like permease